MVISKDKHYRTRGGQEVHIAAIIENEYFPVNGIIKDHNGEWMADCWTINGYFEDDVDGFVESDLDLIEVKLRIKRTYWVNIDKQTDDFFHTKEDADKNAPKHRIACVKFEIECEEGDGL